MKQKRLILCKDCSDWEMCPDVELGLCNFDDLENITWYNGQCIYGIKEKIKIKNLNKLLKEI
jgi:hypothetical protein